MDHIGIEKAAGIEQVLSGSTMDEVARLVRLQLEDRLPPIQIPVKVQQSIDLPAVTTGPVRIDGARMPLQVAVSQVLAGQGRLWIAVHFQPGDLVEDGRRAGGGRRERRRGRGEPRRGRRGGRRQAGGQGQGEVTMRAPSAVAALAVSSALAASLACGREDRQTPDQLRAEIQALEKERESLRQRVDELIVNDPRVKTMPDTPVRVGVPTTLARDLIQRVVAGFVDQVTLELKNLKVKKSGTVKKVVTLGEYDLNVDDPPRDRAS